MVRDRREDERLAKKFNLSNLRENNSWRPMIVLKHDPIEKEGRKITKPNSKELEEMIVTYDGHPDWIVAADVQFRQTTMWLKTMRQAEIMGRHQGRNGGEESLTLTGDL